MIKIISGYSEKGGSTIALINLTNALNERGIEAKFYGPHTWHLDKCKAGIITPALKLDENDSVIAHYIKLPERPNVKKIVLASHEKWWFKVGDIRPVFWDSVVFLHEEHRKYHSEYHGNSTIIPNLKESLDKKDKSGVKGIAGVIGTIEDRKQTHISIQRAIEAGCTEIRLYGSIGDTKYFDEKVKPLMIDKNIKVMGFSTDKQAMYDSVESVYHSSKGEVACLVKDECWLTGTLFFGNEETEHKVSELNNDEIIRLWLKILGL